MKQAAASPGYLLLKARAEKIPLLDGSARLVLVTPPYYGAKGIPQDECCTRDAEGYADFLARCLEESGRVAKRGGTVLLHTNLPPIRSVGGVPRIVFQVYLRETRGKRRTLRRLRPERFTARHARVKGIRWVGLPVWLYRTLVERYSHPGERVVHVFSGSGNGALAALGLLRKPVLIDLHHHKQVRRRLNKRRRRKQTDERERRP